MLNPRIYNVTMPKPDGTNGTATRADSVERTGVISWFLRTESKRQTKKAVSPQELQGFKERVRARKEHPELASSMFLWMDFGKENIVV